MRHLRIVQDRGEEGMTVAELAVATAVLMIVMAMVLQVLTSTQDLVQRESDRSETSDRGRLALDHVEKAARSAVWFFDPADAGMSVRLATQPTGPAGTIRCTQYRVTSTGALETRSWTASGTATSQPWSTVANGLRNVALTTAAFALDTTTPSPNRLLNVRLILNSNTRSGRDLDLDTAVARHGVSLTSAPACNV